MLKEAGGLDDEFESLALNYLTKLYFLHSLHSITTIEIERASQALFFIFLDLINVCAL
jgi:hypothetical protein